MKVNQIILSTLNSEVVSAPAVALKERKLSGPVRRIHACKAGWLYRPSAQGLRGVETTEEQLEQMVENFYAQPETSAKPVYIGHPDAEGIEAESYGWIIGAESMGLDLFLYVETGEELEAWINTGKFGYCSIFYRVDGFDRHSAEEWGAELISLGITNQPAKDELSSLQKSEIYFFSNLEREDSSYLETAENSEMAMNEEDIKKVAEALSAQVTAIKLSALEGELAKAVCALLGLPEDASPDDLLAAVKGALEAKAAKEAEEATTSEEKAEETAMEEKPEEEKAEEPKAEEAKEEPAKEEEKLEAKEESAEEEEEEEALSALQKKVTELEAIIKARDVEDTIRAAGIDDAAEIEPLMEVGLSNLDTLAKLLKTRKPATSVVAKDTLSNASKGRKVAPANAFEAEAFSALEGMKKKN